MRARSDPSVVLRAALAGAVVALVRALFVALRDPYLRSGLHALGAHATARAFLAALAWGLAAGLALGALAALGRRRRWLALELGALLAAAVLAFLHASFRLPFEYFYAPGLDSARGLVASAVSLGGALLAAACLAPRLRLPAPRVLGGLVSAGAAASALLLSPAFVCAGAPARWPEQPNLILISLDTLRADRVGCYGYGRGTTPELDRFAERAVRFTRAFSHHPWTLTAHMTMLTGLEPSAHGVDEEHALAEDIPLLPERLRDKGWRTIGVVDTCPWVSPRYGFDRGFDVYRQVVDDADVKIDRALTHIDNLGRTPFFLFVHFFDAHSDFAGLPYESDPEDKERLAGGFTGDFDGCLPDLGCASKLLGNVNKTHGALDPALVRHLSDLYDAGVATLDRKLGRLFRELESRGLLERSVVIVTADHGEELGEHGGFLHEQHFDECVRVPLLLRTPETSGGTSDALVTLADLAPTFLDFAGLSAADRSLAGLGRARHGELQGRDHVVFDSGTGLVGLRSPSFSLFCAGRPEDGAWRVHELASDPRQERDLALAGPLPEDAARLAEVAVEEDRRLHVAFEALRETRPATALSTKQREAVQALGYAGESDDESTAAPSAK